MLLSSKLNIYMNNDKSKEINIINSFFNLFFPRKFLFTLFEEKLTAGIKKYER